MQRWNRKVVIVTFSTATCTDHNVPTFVFLRMSGAFEMYYNNVHYHNGLYNNLIILVGIVLLG